MIVLVACVAGLIIAIALDPHLAGLMPMALLVEGGLLIAIIALYQKQHLDIKRINLEKDQVLNVLKNRMAAIEAAAEGIGIVNPEGILVYMNKALLNIHGIERDLINNYVGHNWLELYSEAGRGQIIDYVMPKLEQDGFWSGVSPILRKDGKVIQVELTLTMLPDRTLIGTARDISERQRASKEKKVLEEQFYQAQKMEAIGRLAGGIAHDFNNILAAIAGYAEFLDEDLAHKPKEQGFARNILKASAQARELVDQMLAFSRQRQSTKDAMDIMAPLDESLSMIKASFPKSIKVQTNFEAETCNIDGNPTQISQLIMNLCVNARDAMSDDKGILLLETENASAEEIEFPHFMVGGKPEDGAAPRIHITDINSSRTKLFMGQILEGQNYFVLKVADNGEGMSRAIMEHIFEPFFTTKTLDKGTGLGLATVHGVITSHHGALVIDSTLNTGTEFRIYFPLVKMLASYTEQPDIIAMKDVSARILLVEDQDDVKLMMLQALHRMGFDVESCSDGKEALDLIKQDFSRFDIIVTDHNMPIMTGLDLVHSVQSFAPDMPFIMVSGYSKERLQELIKDSPGIRAVLRKPVSKNILHEKILAVLAEKKIV